MEARIRLKDGRDSSLARRHPWVFSGAVQSVDGRPEPGETVVVTRRDGVALGYGAWSPASQIKVRMWTFDPSEVVDEALIRSRLLAAVERRGAAVDAGGAACRLVFSESDGLPGVIVDRYGEFLVCQFLSVGAERWKGLVAEVLQERLSPAGMFERSDTDARKRESLPIRTGVLAGAAPPERIEIVESGTRFLVDVRSGHKTGFYLDQRVNRDLVAGSALGRRLLNVFSYSGGFGMAALLRGAEHVTHIDSSASALALADEHRVLNGLPDGAATRVQGDAFRLLRSFVDTGRRFDLVVLDPPKFADRKSQVERAARGYKDINRLAFHLMEPDGLLYTFSCSGAVSADLFRKIVASAALDAGVDATVVSVLTQSPDHPIDIHFPESEYLKGLVCRVTKPARSSGL